MDIGGYAAAGDLLTSQFWNAVSAAQAERSRVNQNEQFYAQMDFNREEAEKARQWQEDIYNKYYSPAAQRRQYEEAGLNPFLAGSKAAPGSAPSASPASSSPGSVGNYVGNYHGSNLASGFLAASESANQRANALETISKAYQRLALTVGKDAALKIVTPYLKSLEGVDSDQSLWMREQNANVEILEARRDLERQEADLYTKYGEKKVTRELWNLDYEYQKSVAQVGLWSSMADLNDSLIALNKSNVRVNDAKIKEIAASAMELLARVTLNLSHAKYFKELGMTESQARQWIVNKLRAESGTENIDFLNVFIDFLQNADLNEWRVGSEGRENALDKYMNEHNVTWDKIDRGLRTLNSGVETAEPFITRKSSVKSQSTSRSTSESRVTHDNVPHNSYEVETHGMTPQGRKKVERLKRYEK